MRAAWLRLRSEVLVLPRLDRPDVQDRRFFFFNDPATTEIYPLSLHDALPISRPGRPTRRAAPPRTADPPPRRSSRSEEHTSELQSRGLISYAVFCLKNRMMEAQRQHAPQSTARAYRRRPARQA